MQAAEQAAEQTAEQTAEQAAEQAAAGRPTVHVVGPNPAVDRIQVVPALVVGGVHRATRVVARPGGKGMIVARAVVRLGGRAALHGFVGGPTGEVVSAGCRALGVADRSVRVDGETRTTTVLVDGTTGASTVVNEPGPEVGPEAVEALVAGVVDAVRPGDLVVCTGSLPPGAPVDLHARLVAAVRGRGARTVVDTSGAALAHAVRSGPDVLKVNEHELRADSALARPGDDGGDLEVLLRRALEAGAGAAIATRGADGLSYRSAERSLDVASPPVAVVNATGSGDLLLAGFVTALADGEDLAAALQQGAAAGAAGAAALEPDLAGREQVEALRPLAAVTERRAPGR